MIAAAVVCFLAAAMATVFPVLSNYYTEKHRSEIRTEYFQTVEALDTSELEAARKAAQEYNVMIANGVIQNDAPFSDGNINTAMQGYTELLNINGDGIMAYIDIPKLGIYLPVYVMYSQGGVGLSYTDKALVLDDADPVDETDWNNYRISPDCMKHVKATASVWMHKESSLKKNYGRALHKGDKVTYRRKWGIDTREIIFYGVKYKGKCLWVSSAYSKLVK